jgi:hypothetical protein
VGYGGGLIYGMRFLRKNNLSDTRVHKFVGETLFGRIGQNYKMFYEEHGKRHGKTKTRLLLFLHMLSAFIVLVFPFFIG